VKAFDEFCLKDMTLRGKKKMRKEYGILRRIIDNSVSDTIRRADKFMYENKRQGKAKNG